MSEAQGFKVDNTPKPIAPITGAELLAMDIPPRATLMSPWLPESGAAMIYAPRGIGKTHLALSIGCAVATGSPFLRWKVAAPRRGAVP